MAMARMRDIAERAGVSRTTVSSILNDKPTNVRVSEETRRRVLQAAAELGYRRSELARAVNIGRQQAIGFVFEQSLLFNRIGMLTGAMEQAAEAGYYIRLIPTTIESLRSGMVERITEMRLTGVIAAFIESEIISLLEREMNRYGVPLVVLETGSVYTQLSALSGANSKPVPETTENLVNVTEYGAKEATAYLISLGHRRILHIAGIDNSATRMRNRGFHRALQEADLTPRLQDTVYSHYADAAVIEAVRPALLQPERPTALLCANDTIAMSAMRAARRVGLHLPDDLAVIGFGDIPAGGRLDPALTTVAVPYEEAGRAVIRLLLTIAAEGQFSVSMFQENRVHSESTEKFPFLPLIVSPPRLIIRESALPPKMASPDK
ncbi:MAG: LacI family DNA-binding transcriptional regulator [Armatimonadaceae bacterium]